MFIPRKILEEKLKALLAEDIGQGDITAASIIPANLTVEAEIIAKENGVVAGIEEAIILAQTLGVNIKSKVADGVRITNRQVLLEISGDAKTILSIERTMLNLLTRMSGIATKTSILSQKLKQAGVKTKIAATRKSAPGLLYFDKKAVFLGGGDLHRLHLDDMILIKDNHLAIIGSVEEAVKKAKATASFTKKIEIEVTSIKDALIAAKEGADIVMLDNFSPENVKVAVEELRRAGFDQVFLEASGGINEENLLEYALAEADILSIGGLTHSVASLDISLEIKRNSLSKQNK
jgi:nicotinate-nucleotide pyrophosphorylase (carboxylating)